MRMRLFPLPGARGQVQQVGGLHLGCAGPRQDVRKVQADGQLLILLVAQFYSFLSSLHCSVLLIA